MTGPVLRPAAAVLARVGDLRHGADAAPLTVTRDRPVEYSRLIEALKTTRAACAGDDRYTTDPLTALPPDDLDAMGARCHACRVLTVCDAYALAASPTAGFWAGRIYPSEEPAR